MNQFNWTYLADNGKRHQVVLMHGATSGHLLVYCNTNILLIDFSVLKTSSYSFFIEEELCELTVERKGDQFYYGFEVNRDADTPLNNQRKKLEKKHLFQSIFFLGGLLLVISFFIVGLTYYHKNRDQSEQLEQLLVSGKQTTARITNIPEGAVEEVDYFFLAKGASYSASALLPQAEEEGSLILLESGMPLEEGDEFAVRYLPATPQRNLLDFNLPSSNTIEKYKERAAKKYLISYPETSKEKAACMIEIAYKLRNIEGLSEFYFSSTSPKINSKHNKNSFKRLIRDLPFQNAMNKKCQGL